MQTSFKKNSDFFERILQIIEYKRINSVNEFAIEYLKYKAPQKINRLKDPKNNPSYEIILDIVNKFEEIEPEWLLTGKEPMLKTNVESIQNNIVENERVEYIPLIPIEAMAGKGNNGLVQISKDDIIDGYVIPEFTQKGVEYIIRVSGSSMYPKYSSGDLLGCKTVNDTSFFQWGKIYVLDTDQGPMVKRLFPSDKEDYLECRSDNKDYPPFPIHRNSIYKIAIVVGVLRLE